LQLPRGHGVMADTLSLDLEFLQLVPQVVAQNCAAVEGFSMLMSNDHNITL
jgi:hypothetical protein